METASVNQNPGHSRSNRSGKEDLRAQADRLRAEIPVETCFDAVNDLVLVLNHHLQAVYANDNCLQWLGKDSVEALEGGRPGEVFGCARALLTGRGCGTSEYCRECGAFHAVCKGLEGNRVEEECRMVLEANKGALDLWIRATPLEVAGEHFVVMAISDIGDEKRRKALERICFKDLQQYAERIHGLADVFMHASAAEKHDYGEALRETSARLLEEIRGQSILLSAENGELTVRPEAVEVLPFLQSLQSRMQNRHVGQHERIVLRVGAELSLVTDPNVLERVLTLMLSNALEASSNWETVTVTAREEKGRVFFSVQNLSVMPPKVRRQVFQRSFSTKAEEGRGLGTYSMRLLAERYLRGRLSFTSEEGEGTTFVLDIPKGLGPVKK